MGQSIFPHLNNRLTVEIYEETLYDKYKVCIVEHIDNNGEVRSFSEKLNKHNGEDFYNITKNGNTYYAFIKQKGSYVLGEDGKEYPIFFDSTANDGFTKLKDGILSFSTDYDGWNYTFLEENSDYEPVATFIKAIDNIDGF